MTRITKLLLSIFLTSSALSSNYANAAQNVKPTKVIRKTPSKGSVAKEEKTEKRKLTSFDLACAGSLATMIGDAALHPVDCIKTLQQSTEGTGLSMVGASKKIMKDFGIGGFYSGLGTYVLSDGGAGAIKFAT